MTKNTSQQMLAILEKMQRDAPTSAAIVSACDLAIRSFNGAEAQLKEWRKAVFRGETEFDIEDEAKLKATFEAFTSLSECLLGNIDRLFVAGGMPVEKWDVVHLKNRNKKAKKVLAQWSSPARSTAIGLRTRVLSDDNQTRLNDLLNQRTAT